MIKKDNSRAFSMIFSMECNDYWCITSKVILGFTTPVTQKYIDYTPYRTWPYTTAYTCTFIQKMMMYNACWRVFITYVVFAIRNESTMVNSRYIQILYYCFTLQRMIQLSSRMDSLVVSVTHIDIDMDIFYLVMSTVRTDPIVQSVRVPA